MAKLNDAQRNKLPASEFAEPGKRKYPIMDKNHARAALSRVSANGTPAEKATIRRKVANKYPGIAVNKSKTWEKSARKRVTKR